MGEFSGLLGRNDGSQRGGCGEIRPVLALPVPLKREQRRRRKSGLEKARAIDFAMEVGVKSVARATG